MPTLFFVNTGWLPEYQGEDVKIQNGGQYVADNDGDGHETHNFYQWENGNFYGCTPAGNREIHIERLGAGRNDEYIEGITVVFTATRPRRMNGGRYIVGWYNNATVFRQRPQHPYMKGFEFSINTIDAVLIPEGERNFQITKSYYNSFYGDSEEDKEFISQVKKYIKGYNPNIDLSEVKPDQKHSYRVSAATAATDLQTRQYTRNHEIKISPLHNILQTHFQNFLIRNGCEEGRMVFECRRFDLQYTDINNNLVLVEVKPIHKTSEIGLAIRFAIGQLIEYNYFLFKNEIKNLVIVIGCEPPQEIIDFTTSLNIKIAYPENGDWKGNKKVINFIFK